MQESNRKALNCQVYNNYSHPNHDVKKPFKKNYFYQGKKYVRMYLQTHIHRTWKECIKGDLKIQWCTFLDFVLPVPRAGTCRDERHICNLGFELSLLIFVDYVIYKHAKHTHDHGESLKLPTLRNRTSTLSVTFTSSHSWRRQIESSV